MKLAEKNVLDLFTTVQCESLRYADKSKSFENISCTELLPSICFIKGKDTQNFLNNLALSLFTIFGIIFA